MRPDNIAERIERARSMYRACNACAWRCGVNRVDGERGRCGLTTGARVARESISQGEEGDLSPSHLVYFAGCSFRCVFCLSGEMVVSPTHVSPTSRLQLVDAVMQRRAQGAVNVNLLGGDPSVNLLEALELVADMPADHPVVWNSNMFHSEEVRELLNGVVDVWLADFKFGTDACGQRLAAVENYVAVVTENLRHAFETGTRVIVRHLLMPGHLECCTRPVLAFLSHHLACVEVSLTSAFLPLHQTARCPELLTQHAPDGAALLAEYGLRAVTAAPSSPSHATRGYQGALFVAADGTVTLMDPSPAVAAWLVDGKPAVSGCDP